MTSHGQGHTIRQRTTICSTSSFFFDRINMASKYLRDREFATGDDARMETRQKETLNFCYLYPSPSHGAASFGQTERGWRRYTTICSQAAFSRPVVVLYMQNSNVPPSLCASLSLSLFERFKLCDYPLVIALYITLTIVVL
jgi:hypothetical protein